MYRIIQFVVVILLWVLAMMLFKRTKMNFFRFMVGSVGIFTISMIFFMPYFERALNTTISRVLDIIGSNTGYYRVFAKNSIVSIDTKDGIVSMLINYECSGIIEMLVFTSLSLFFPFGSLVRRGMSVVLGNMYVYAANIIRILFIIGATKILGASAFYLVHTLLARILFFALMIVLYYFVFTSTQLKYQNVGDIR